MPLNNRLALYEQLELARARPLIVYVTSSRPNAGGLMASDAIPQLLDQLTALPPNGDAVDLLVVSQGGDATVAWRAMSLLRERFKDVAVLVPQAAYSAATLLALGANSIVMHPHGNLGPVDPQILVKRKSPNGEQDAERFGFEELTGFIEFAREQAGLSDQKHISELLKAFCDEVGAVRIGTAARGSLLSISMGEKLLRMHMTEDADATKAKVIAETLNKKFFHHGYPVSRTEAKEIGLRIAEPNEAVEGLMWDIWSDIEDELKVREPFSPMNELFAHENGKFFSEPSLQISIPAGLPSSVQQQLIQQALNKIQVVQTVSPVEFEWVHAVMESRRACSRSVANGKIFAMRQPDLNVKMNMVHTAPAWKCVEMPGAGNIPPPHVAIGTNTEEVVVSGPGNHQNDVV